MRRFDFRNFFRSSGRDHFAAADTAFGAEIDDVIGRLYYVEIVFDNDDARSAFDQCTES